MPKFQKKNSLVERFRHEMMQADERRQRALFVTPGSGLVITAISADQQIVIERYDIQDKEQAMDSIHDELEQWMFSGNRNGRCDILSVDLREPKPERQKHGFTGIANAKTVTIPCPICEGIDPDECECCIGKGVVVTTAKETAPTLKLGPTLTMAEAISQQDRMNGFAD